jgi:hypothetical protein
LHHEAGAALGYVREHRFAAMQPHRVAQVHGEYEVDHGPCRQSKGFDLEEDTHG